MSLDRRTQLDALAEIYSLIISIDHVERAYIRDTITSHDYNEVMPRLLSQYDKFVREPSIESIFNDLDSFVQQYKVEASTGVQRIKVGIPATAEAVNVPSSANNIAQRGTSAASGKSGKAVAQVAGNFITFSDGIHLGFRGKNDLHPLLADLATSLNAVTKENFDGRAKIVEWLIKLNQLKVGQTITEEESEKCLSDVQAGYNSFLALLD